MSGPHKGPPGTGTVEHAGDKNGVVHAPVLGLGLGRSIKAYGDWFKTRGPEFTAGAKTAAVDPFRSKVDAIGDELPKAITILDALHVANSDQSRSITLGAVASRRPPYTVGERGTRSPGSAGHCTSEPTPHRQTSRQPMPDSALGTPNTRSRSPGSAIKSSATFTTPLRPADGNS